MFVEKKALSSMKNSPKVSIGMPKRKNMGYHPEVYTEFLGSSSPACTKYHPNNNVRSTKSLQPKYSVGKFERFHKPSSISKVQAQLPTGYQKIDTEINVPTYDLMGLGKRFSYKMNKED